MSTALDLIIDYKRDEVAALKRAESFASLARAASEASPVRGFAAAMSAIAASDENALICELKRKSPSAGEILPGADPVAIASEYEAGGAACLSILTDDQLAGELHAAADDFAMDVLIETHDESELERALKLASSLIGINNRDLKRMVTDLSTTERLAPMVPPDRHVVAESGISSTDHIVRLRETGARRFLIGESLMKMNQLRESSVTGLRKARSN